MKKCGTSLGGTQLQPYVEEPQEKNKQIVTLVAQQSIRLEVELEGAATEGAVLVYQIKSLDFENRGIELIEQALPVITNKVTELAQIIVK